MDLVDFLARLEILAFSPFGLVDRHRTLVEARKIEWSARMKPAA